MLADPSVHIGENTPEYVALLLLEMIARVEGKSLDVEDVSEGRTLADRSWILNTYTECLNSVRQTPLYSMASVELNP